MVAGNDKNKRSQLQQQLQFKRVLYKFVMECAQARNEPIDMRAVLFEDDVISNQELIGHTLIQLHRKADAEPTVSRQQLKTLAAAIENEIDHLEDELYR